MDTATAIDRQEVGLQKPQTKLEKILARRQHAQQEILLLDTSGSMASEADNPGERRIDALRGVVAMLRNKGLLFKQACFNSGVVWSDVVTEPAGGTNLSGALEFIEKINPRHVIIVSDGEPDNKEAALAVAKRLGCKIDVFYVGPKSCVEHRDFLLSLATSTGGTSEAVSFKELEVKIAGMLSDGSEAKREEKPIAL